MPPRFIERIHRKAETLNAVFGDDESKPPSYVSARSSFTPSAGSSRSSTQTSQTLPTPPPNYLHVGQQSSSIDETAIPKNSLILVTAANSFQGSHIVDQLLVHGHRVRGTVRDAENATRTSKYFEDKYGTERYTAMVVPDMAVKGAFDIAIRSCAGVIHVASVTSMSPDPNEVITPSIAGALNLLEAANQESSVLRFVFTSSIAAAISHDRAERKEVRNDTWNMMDYREAWSQPPYEDERAYSVYCCSKMQTEAAVWRWYELWKPNFVLNTVLPDTLWGRMLDPKHQNFPLSITVLNAVFEGDPPEYPPCNFVDVQDSALLHVAALILSDVQGQRIFAVSAPWNIKSLVELVKGLFPLRNIAGTVGDVGVDQTNFREAVKAEELLKRMGKSGWTDIRTSVQRNCEAFV